MNIEEKLKEIEKEVEKGNLKLKELNFWEIVYKAKLDRNIANMFGKKIADINKKVFEKRWKLKFKPILGVCLLLVISLITIYFYFLIEDHFYFSLYLPIASFILSASLHVPVQYLIGRILGIKFIYIYPRGIYMFERHSKGKIKIEPALKLDLESYLKASSIKRLIFHISGPALTIIVVSYFFIISLIYNAELWSQIICGLITIVYILTDLTYSRKKAGIKHFLEEYKIYKLIKRGQ